MPTVIPLEVLPVAALGNITLVAGKTATETLVGGLLKRVPQMDVV